MNFYDYFAVFSLSIAISVNSVLVYLQKRFGLYRRFGSNAWQWHQIIISIFWSLAVIAGFTLSRSRWQMERSYGLIGGAAMIIAIGLFVGALRQIGFQALGNGNYFGAATRQLGGIYKLINEPIYLSYFLWYVGLGLLTAKITFFVMAFIVVVGLIGVEARIEMV